MVFLKLELLEARDETGSSGFTLKQALQFTEKNNNHVFIPPVDRTRAAFQILTPWVYVIRGKDIEWEFWSPHFYSNVIISAAWIRDFGKPDAGNRDPR